jgi:YrbI family 3-deoxy-D-manno-octulosonate 8-phosphate phosphatase
MRLIAIIPARGGSKGIPGKNLREVGGQPLVALSVRAALDSGCCERVVVTTDSEDIAAAARAAGAEVVERPAELAGDTASSESALLHALDALNQRGVPDPDALMFLQCTSPLTRACDLSGMVEHWERAGADVALAVTPSHAFLWRPGADGALEGVNHDSSVRLRRQDLPPEYRETGAAYLMRTAGFRAGGHRFFGKVVPWVIPAERSVDVDDRFDLELVRSLYRREATTGALPERVEAVVFDFDGVLTDNRVLVDQNGVESVTCSRGDGMGISQLRQAGVQVFVISKERNPVVEARCRKLQIEFLQAIDDKRPALERLLAERGLTQAGTVFVGNDINDVECMRWAACGVAVADAHSSALAAADLVLERPGGYGAARELADRILGRAEA